MTACGVDGCPKRAHARGWCGAHYQKARDVLHPILPLAPDTADRIITALLAQTPAGEGVYIAPDGTLMRAIDYGKHETGIGPLHRLVPIEETTVTDPAEIRAEGRRLWAAKEIAHGSGLPDVVAEAMAQPPPHLTPEEVQEIRDWIATPPTSHVDDLIYRALRELSEIRQYEDPRDDGSYD